MAPRDLRREIRAGNVLAAPESRLPKPPPEWPEWRRARLRIAIQCAVLFLYRGYSWAMILKVISGSKMATFDKKAITKTRVLQYVKRGALFLDEAGVFKVAK